MKARKPRIAADARGSTLVEFGFVIPILAVVLMGFFDLGYRSYVGAMVHGALSEATRMATVGNRTGAQIDALITSRLEPIARDGTLTVSKKSYFEFSDVRVAERITQDTAPVGSYNAGDCFEDANRNNAYDVDRGKTGLGGADDVILYEVTMVYPRLFPMAGLLGWPSDETVRASTLLRNQPFAARTNGVVIVCLPAP